MKKFIIYFIVGFVLTHLIVSCEPKANIDLPNGVSSIILGLEQIDMYEGETRQIYARYNTGESCSPIWHSANEKVASVDSLGDIIALKEGSTEIWASLNTQTSTLTSNKCIVTVLKDSVVLNETQKILFVGESFHLSAHLKSQNNKPVSFSSHDPQIASVDNNGNIIANANGNTLIIATIDTLKASCIVQVRETTGTENGHNWVDLGLSVRWATMNIGATAPEGKGNHYAWAETSTKYSYDWGTYKWALYGPYIANGQYHSAAITKYQYPDGFTDSNYYRKDSSVTEVDGFTKVTYEYVFIGDGKTRIELEDDAANVSWGGSWRMPTKDEYQELIDNCEWEWLQLNGIEGSKVTSKKNGKWIFLPAINPIEGNNSMGNGAFCSYWASDMTTISVQAYYLYFRSEAKIDNYYRYIGRTIRAVLE